MDAPTSSLVHFETLSLNLKLCKGAPSVLPNTRKGTEEAVFPITRL